MILTMIAATAWADWPNATLVAEESGTVFPSAVAVRNWGPMDRVYIVVEKQDIDQFTPATSLELYRYLCFGGASCTPSLHTIGTWPMAVGGTIDAQVNLHPAMAIDADAQGVEDVDIIRRAKIDLDCDNDGNTTEAAENALDLQNYDYRTDTNAMATRLRVESNVGNAVNDACIDTGVSMLKKGGALNACYTYKENPQVQSDDRLKCNDASGNPSGEWANDLLLTSSVVEDHPAFDFKDGDRVVVGGRRPVGDDEIRFHFPDTVGEPTFDLSVDGDMAGDPILPDVISVGIQSGDIMLAVWEAEDLHKEIRLGRCPAADDCQQSGDWIVTTPVTTIDGRLEHPEIAHDGAFQILVWEEDDDENPDNGGERIYAATRCGVTGAWGTPELLRTPDNALDSQSILFANPHVVLNREDNVAHVVFQELNPNPQVLTSEVWWVRKSYTDCP